MIIETEGLSKRYGRRRGIDDVTLGIGQGEIFGFLGPNGAGKTTTIRTLLGHLRPTAGRARIFGLDVTTGQAAIHRRLGYLPGEFGLYDRLTGAQTADFFGRLYGGVDRAYRDRLMERLGVDPGRRFRELSKGNKQKIGLVVAFQHRPDLLVLDEPTSGLDPLVQREFHALVREARDEGRTVFLSSHVLSEVEAVCDRVALIRDGRIVRAGSVESLRDLAHHQVLLRFAERVPVDAFAHLPGVSDVEVTGHTLRLRVSGPMTPVVRAAAAYELLDFESREPGLEETFLRAYQAAS
ncbi:ABC transporter ATP-binding protein [Catenuloplanes indicus]|uniref:ABC-2 type transport system ATP-binding protein n=1 Tax=Catenuloplanes indicus TaxID=137267 RepID=A0AAE3VUW7_9ACTN|nr:ABC transporter ATP-binding protein [Catenuloplanes indicus]MDQ0363475.1 ABC-2 type transport system ATP-binding protein [Catenuloplanes indicus]